MLPESLEEEYANEDEFSEVVDTREEAVSDSTLADEVRSVFTLMMTPL